MFLPSSQFRKINSWKTYYIATNKNIVLYDTLCPEKSILSKVVIVDVGEDKSICKICRWRCLKNLSKNHEKVFKYTDKLSFLEMCIAVALLSHTSNKNFL